MATPTSFQQTHGETLMPEPGEYRDDKILAKQPEAVGHHVIILSIDYRDTRTVMRDRKKKGPNGAEAVIQEPAEDEVVLVSCLDRCHGGEPFKMFLAGFYVKQAVIRFFEMEEALKANDPSHVVDVLECSFGKDLDGRAWYLYDPSEYPNQSPIVARAQERIAREEAEKGKRQEQDTKASYDQMPF